MTAPHLEEFHDLVSRIADAAEATNASTLDLLDRYLLYLQVAPMLQPIPFTPDNEDDLLETFGGTD